MMAEKARLFKDHRAAELIMSTPDPSTLKRVSRGVRNFDPPVWDREKLSAVLAGTYANFLPNPRMKLHLLSTGNTRLAEASPLDPVWGISLRADDPEPRTHTSGEEIVCSVRQFLPFAKQFATARPGRHTRPTLVGSAAPLGMLESTKSRPLCRRARGPRPAFAKALLRRFRPIFWAHPPTKTSGGLGNSF